DIEAPVASYWPEFAVNGKERITIRHVLTHTSGVVSFPDYRRDLSDPDWWLDPKRIAASFAPAAAEWEPGAQHGYHGLSFGWLLGEVVRRAAGATLGTVFRQEVAEPLGIDFWIGLPEEHHARVAHLIDAPPVEDPTVAAYLSVFIPDTISGRAHFVGERGFMEVAADFNDPAAWRAEIPGGGGIGAARGIARMYAALAAGGELDGVRIVSKESTATHTAQAVSGFDGVLLFDTRFALGYMLPTPFTAMGPNDEAFGHGGLGGSLGFADPVRNVAIGYAMNQIQFPNLTTTTRAQALVNALYEGLG
ncbi:MAG: serine hydrolase domain-containing protein, partial [Acidimicrobiia bacterium]